MVSQAPSEEVMLEVEVTDREISYLTAFWVNHVQPKNLKEQQVINHVFDLFQMDRFDVVELNPTNVPLDRRKFELSERHTAFVLSTLNTQMNIRFARNIGGGSAFFNRLMQAKPKAEPAKPAEAPTDGDPPADGAN